jgi:ribonucleoside-diphosphate reductase alpha chain
MTIATTMKAHHEGLVFERVFSVQGQDPFESVRWVNRTAVIRDDKGREIFRQDDVEVPVDYDEITTNVVASKYFYGDPNKTLANGQPERETSVRQLVHRVARTIAEWGIEDGVFENSAMGTLFYDELVVLLLKQYAAFNSPVWFNVGLHHLYGIKGTSRAWRWDIEKEQVVRVWPGEAYKHPQGSACFIQSVSDDMESIMGLAISEAMLFKYGSGCLDQETLVLTDRGLVRLATIGDPLGPKWQSAALQVQTDEGPRETSQFYVNGVAETRRLRTVQGTEFRGTPDHKIKVVQLDGSWAWRRLDEVKTGDILPLKIGGMTGSVRRVELPASDHQRKPVGMPAYRAGTPTIVTPELAELIGNFMGNGSTHDKSLRFLVCQDDPDVRDRIVELILQLFGWNSQVRDAEGHWVIELNSTVIRSWWEAAGFCKKPIPGKTGKGSKEPLTPDAILATNDPLVYGAFLRGLMEADGGVNKGIPYLSTSYAGFGQQVRTILLALGMPTRTSESIPGAKSRGGGINWQIGLRNATYNPIFMERIGFIGARKNAQVKDQTDSRQRGKNDHIWMSEAEVAAFVESVSWEQGKASVQLAHRIYRRAMTRKLAQRIYRATGDQRLGYLLGYSFETIESVEDGGCCSTLDITVPSNHSYIAYGLITHNTGTDLSTLRSSREKVSGGGRASGPVSFMVIYDGIASTIKSGGKTRRAAKLQSLKCAHPDILEFIEAKAKEERKALALIAAGYDPDFNGEAYATVRYQNCNMSVRVTDDFLQAVEMGKCWQTIPVLSSTPTEEMPRYQASDLLDKIAEGAWTCGDPGLQYEDTIQKWHTCPNSGHINSSNPCSEFMFLDDTSCNLASLNLLKFRKEDGTFDVDRYRAACKIMITAQEILVDHGSYPTEKIAENSHRFRPLGLGYCNLGALIMAMGKPYDSIEGRATCAVLTAILTGQGYLTSAELAYVRGPFDGFSENRAPMLNVMDMHREAIDNIEIDAVAPGLLAAAREVWNEAILTGSTCGFRNSQISVIAPTGTIAFMMGADTTGIEPEIGLVKYKNLAGGGQLKIVNNTVATALKSLGYSDGRTAELLNYIEEYGTAEGAPNFKTTDLPVFDCAFVSPRGTRSISFEGHVRMMGAAQPFVSGAISKTCNLPSSATVEEVREAYVLGWKLGLKALAIFRDGSKGSQPVIMKAEPAAVTKSVTASVTKSVAPYRRRLPDTRNSVTHKFVIDSSYEGYLIVGLYEDGTPGELFIEMAKEGSTVGGLMDTIGTLVSMSLQYGVPMAVLVEKFTHARFDPSGFTKNPDIPLARSVIDYIFRWLGIKFIPGYREQTVPSRYEEDHFDMLPMTGNANSNGVAVATQRPATVQLAGPPCGICGAVMVPSGARCYRCLNCGNPGPCG